MINVIRYRYIFLGVAALVVAAAIVALATLGLTLGIDFHGGILWQLAIPSGPAAAEVEQTLKTSAGLPEVKVTRDATANRYLIRLPAGEIETADILAGLREKYPAAAELSFQSIGPSVGEELRRRAVLAIVFVLVGISTYIAFAFRKVQRPVSSWKYGAVTLLTLFHDVIIPTGLLAVLGYYGRVEVDGNFVVALLVVVGFSVHDTIVVFDRIRENLAHPFAAAKILGAKGGGGFGEIVNASVNQTMARSINTSLTLIIVLVTLYFLGPLALRYFILTLLVGVSVGVYSSIFVASPLLYLWHGEGGK